MSTAAITGGPLAVYPNSRWGAPTSAANALNTFMRAHGDGIRYPDNGKQGSATLQNLKSFVESDAFKKLTAADLNELQTLVRRFQTASDGTFFAKKDNGMMNGGLNSAIGDTTAAINAQIAALSNQSGSPAPAGAGDGGIAGGGKPPATTGAPAGGGQQPPPARTRGLGGSTGAPATQQINLNQINKYTDLPQEFRVALAKITPGDFTNIKNFITDNLLPSIARSYTDQAPIIDSQIKPIVQNATDLPDLLDKLFKSSNGADYARVILSKIQPSQQQQ